VRFYPFNVELLNITIPMCKVSTKLKLCSCKIDNVESLPHYWILHTRTGMEQHIVGEAMMPAPIDEESAQYNSNTLKRLLNSGKCFDVEMHHQEGDQLELYFSYKPDSKKYLVLPCHGNYLVYVFVFKNDKWRKMDYDPFHENLIAKQLGSIHDPFRPLAIRSL
jgi:hypothetical protein